MATHRTSLDSTITSNINYVFDNISSPYFLHHGDSAGTSLVSQLITGCKNYHNWTTAVRTAQLQKELGFVHGSNKQPATDDPEPGVRIRFDRMVLFWIMNSISKEIASSIIYLILAKDTWKDLFKEMGQESFYCARPYLF